MHYVLVKLFWSIGLSQCVEMVLIHTIHKMTTAETWAFLFGGAVEKFSNARKCTETMMTKQHVEHGTSIACSMTHVYIPFNAFTLRAIYVCLGIWLRFFCLCVSPRQWIYELRQQTTNASSYTEIHRILLLMCRTFDTRRPNCRFISAWKWLQVLLDIE